jgi:formylglycine-generating enzyme required for sulfatase activity/predicted Ser/Thr protein kinase
MATNDGNSPGRAPDTLPEVFGRYRIKRKLGGGGMGTVYLVENTELQREEALKVPRFEADDTEGHERFLREARAAATLHHPNLCPIYHVGVQDGVSFLTMHYLQGRPLSDYTNRPQPPREAVKIVAKLAQALEYAHGEGVVHRDLTPSNIMMCAGVGPVVLDFGLAKQLRQTDQKLTQTGAVRGTPAYMSPEQVKSEGERIGPASDIYSLGVILWELLAGQQLFQGKLGEVFGNILYAEPPPPSALRAGLGPVLDAICRKALAKTPEERYATMKAFGTALADYLRAKPAPEGTGKLKASKAERADLLRAVTVLPSQARAPSLARQDQTAAAPVRARAGSEGKSSGRRWGVLVGLLGCLGLLLLVGVLVMNLLAWGGKAPVYLLPRGDTATSPETAQAAWAKHLGRKVEEEDEIAPGVKMAFVLVPPGKFLMGSPTGEQAWGEEHEVTITEPFYLGKHEVTQAQYEAVVGQGKNPSTFRGAELPVESVTWTEASAYADSLTRKRAAKLLYRLPTEAEWEYSCRGGRASSRPFGIGDGTSLSSDQANFDGNYPYGGAANGKCLGKTTPVGSYPPNAFSLHDMHGNVWEWCADWYGPYPAGKATNPCGPLKGSSRVFRGGGWHGSAGSCRAADRLGRGPGDRADSLGFRLARVPSGK